MGLSDFIFGESKDDLRAKIEDVQEKNKAQLAEINSLKVSFDSQRQELEKNLRESKKELNKVRMVAGDDKKKTKQEAERKIKQAQKDLTIWKASLREKNLGFPTLLNAIKDYEAIREASKALVISNGQNDVAWLTAGLASWRRGDFKRSRVFFSNLANLSFISLLILSFLKSYSSSNCFLVISNSVSFLSLISDLVELIRFLI